MRNTGVTDVYGLSIPVVVESVTTHCYINGDGFSVIVRDNGTDKVSVAIFMPDDFVPIEEQEVAKEDVQALVLNLFGKYRF
jgi:hypothetical protein